MALPYDKTDAYSIFEYSKQLLNRSLRDFSDASQPENVGRGGLGDMVERYFFGYNPNSNPGPDFEEAGLELKCTPLKRSAKNELLIKERLVCTMINYCDVVNEENFEHSHFYLKCQLMLLLFYLHQSGVSRWDLEFIYSVLWRLPEKDLLIIKQDYEKILNKIRQGNAHELSEGDTMYLGACHKAATAANLTKQPFSDIPAQPRAFSLKGAYMRTVLDFVKASKKNAVCNFDNSLDQLVSSSALKKQSFDDIILSRFDGYIDLDEKQLAKKLHVDLTKNAKSKFFQLANAIVGKGKCSNINRSEEFLKAGLQMKTIRVQADGKIKEAMAFENINYQEIYENEDWYESRLYEIFSGRFLFVIFREQNKGQGDYILDDVFFWTMPQEDLIVAKEYWENIRENVLHDLVNKDCFWKGTDKRNFHVRPKAQKAVDRVPNPLGSDYDPCKKFCYWFNNDYIRKIVKKKLR